MKEMYDWVPWFTELALVYPQTRKFRAPLTYRLVDELTLLCLPFDVSSPKNSVQESIRRLNEV